MDMEFDYSLTNKVGITPKIGLSAVYKEYTDSRYIIKRTDTDRNVCIVIRTTKGKGQITINKTVNLVLPPESIVFIYHNTVTQYCCIGNEWDFWWFEFNQEGELEFPLDTVLSIPFVVGEADDCNSCLEILRLDSTYGNMLASARFSVLLLKWLMQNQRVPLRFIPHKSSVDKVISLMKSKLSQSLTVGRMAEETGLSERRFRQVFEKVTGLPPKRYYDRLRFATAEELLLFTPFSLEEISERLSFSSQFHFSSFFKKYKGISPAIYRKACILSDKKH